MCVCVVQSELSVMSRVIGRSAVAGAFPAGRAPFETKAAETLVPTEKANHIFTMQRGGVGIEGCCAAFSDLFMRLCLFYIAQF